MKKAALILAAMAFLIIGYSQDKVNLSRDTVVAKTEVVKLAVTADSSVKELAVKDTIITNLHEQMARERKQVRKDSLWGVGVNPWIYLYGLFFTLLGIFISNYRKVSKAVARDPNSPKTFSWKYWWDNNRDVIKKWLGNIAVAFVAMRFSNQIFQQELSMFFALVIGLTFETVVDWITNLKFKTKQ